jgi:hypothetical protein
MQRLRPRILAGILLQTAHFCPSCHQKRVVEFGERLCMEVLKKVPLRHFVFSIPKILRRYFLYDRKLLADLSRCAWESLKGFLQDAVPENDPIPGAVIAMQTFGDFLGFNPHCHILVTDGCFYGDGGMFRVAPPLELKKLEAIPRSGRGQASGTMFSKCFSPKGRLRKK